MVSRQRPRSSHWVPSCLKPAAAAVHQGVMRREKQGKAFGPREIHQACMIVSCFSPPTSHRAKALPLSGRALSLVSGREVGVAQITVTHPQQTPYVKSYEHTAREAMGSMDRGRVCPRCTDRQRSPRSRRTARARAAAQRVPRSWGPGGLVSGRGSICMVDPISRLNAAAATVRPRASFAAKLALSRYFPHAHEYVEREGRGGPA